MTNRKTFWLVFLVFIIAVFLRTYRIMELPPGLYPDEAMNGNNAFEANASGNYKVYYPENNGREGLFMNIQAQFLRVLVPWNGGLPEPWMLRLPSAIFGSLTVLGMYFLCRELFRGNDKLQNPNDKSNPNDQNPKSFDIWHLNFGIRRSELIGLAAMFFTATSFWHIMFSRIGFRAIMAPFFLVWAIVLLLIAIRKGGGGRALSSSVLALLAGAVYGAGFYSYIAYRVSPLLLLLVIPLFHKQLYFWRVVSIFILATFFTALPIGLYYLHNPADFLGRATQLSIFSSPTPLQDLGGNVFKTLGMFFVAGDFNERHNLSGNPELFWPVGIMFLLGIVVGVKTLMQRLKIKGQNEREKSQNDMTTKYHEQNLKINPLTLGASSSALVPSSGISAASHQKFGVLVCFAWFFLAMLPVVISNEGLPHALRSILMIPPTMILAALGAAWLYEQMANGKWQMARPKLRFALCALLFAGLTAQAYFKYFVVWANNPDTPGAFAADYAAVGREIRALPPETPKYVVVPASGVLVRGIPMPAQTVMYMTDSFTPDKQQAKNIHYFVPPAEPTSTPGAHVFIIH